MKRLLALLMLMSASGLSQTATPALRNALEKTRYLLELPALGVAYLDAQTPLEIGVVGVRKKGDPTPATANDVWALGSISKTFTATLLARYVEAGKLSWNSTLEQVLKGVPMRPEYKKVTLEMLLAHRAGFPAMGVPELLRYRDLPVLKVSYTEQRGRFLREWLQKKPLFTPGTRARYSNEGFMVAAIVAERVSGLPYPQALEREVFRPLGLKSAGVGVAWPPDKVTQPWPHQVKRAVLGLFGKVTLTPLEPTTDAGNPPVFDGADNVRMNLADLMTYGRAHLDGELGKGGLLKAATFQRLHRAPFGDDYALGWVRAKDGGFWHNGSNTLNYALLTVNPRARRVAIAVTNAFPDGVEDALVGLLGRVPSSR